MITYTVIKTFTITPNNIPLAIGDSVVKYDDSVLVIADGNSITSFTFYNWVGSPSSLGFFEYVSQSDDPSSSTVVPIDLESNFTTTDIVNKINEVIATIS